MSLFSWFTGGSDSAGKVIDGIVDGVDAVFFTDEEKSRANQKILDFKLKYAQATSGQNLARRYIAFGIVGLWIFFVLVGWGAFTLGYVDHSIYVFNLLKDIIAIPFAVVLSFYFAAHVARSIK